MREAVPVYYYWLIISNAGRGSKTLNLALKWLKCVTLFYIVKERRYEIKENDKYKICGNYIRDPGTLTFSIRIIYKIYQKYRT